MKKFRFNLLNRLKKSNDPCEEIPIINQNERSLSTLPVELVEQILDELIHDRPINDSIRDLFSLSATCKYLNNILSNDILYDKVIIRSKRQARSFYKCICSNKNYKKKLPNDTTKPSLFVKHIIFIHPVQDFQADMNHMGHMMTTSSSTPEKSWAESILEIVTKLPNLEHLELREISPNFGFPSNLMNVFPYKVLPKKLISLYMSSEEGWRVGLTESLLWPFVSYQKLYLYSMTLVVLNHSKYNDDINGSQSSVGTNPHSPSHTPSNTAMHTPSSTHTRSLSNSYQSHEIFLSRCKVYPQSRNLISDKSTTKLSIDSDSLQTCELSTMFPQLEYLTVGGIDSDVITEYDSSLGTNLGSGLLPIQFSYKNYSQSSKITSLSNLEPLLSTLTSPESLPYLKSLSIFLSHNLVPNLLVALSERVTNSKTFKICNIILTTKLNYLTPDEYTRLSNVIDSSTTLKESLEVFMVRDSIGSTF